jgi:hypothetical protein
MHNIQETLEDDDETYFDIKPSKNQTENRRFSPVTNFIKPPSASPMIKLKS